VNSGVLNIRDSNALGSSTAGTTVNSGAALELEVDNRVDSATGTVNTLNVPEGITLIGSGVANTGALRSVSGVNVFSGEITLNGTAAIGVEPDPSPTNTNDYFTNDYSLTVTGVIDDFFPAIAGNLVKRGAGHLILPFDNDYNGTTDIQQGWITIQS